MVVLGKRKARATKPEPSHSSSTATGDDAQSVQDIFRRHFEAQFAPLPDSSASSTPAQKHGDVAEEQSGSDSDEGAEGWGGLSANEEDEGEIGF